MSTRLYALLWSMVDFIFTFNSLSGFTLWVGSQEGHPACRNPAPTISKGSSLETRPSTE